MNPVYKSIKYNIILIIVIDFLVLEKSYLNPEIKVILKLNIYNYN